MNPNRQNNRCVTPAGSGFGGRTGGRNGVTPGCGSVYVTPVAVNNCSGAVIAGNVTGNCCEPCGEQTVDSTTGVIISTQGNTECNKECVLNDMPIAMAYVPWQSYGDIYSLQVALQKGTLFQELDLDFLGRRCN